MTLNFENQKQRTPNTNDYHIPLNETPMKRWMCWNIVSFAKYIEKIKLLQEVFDCHFSDLSEEDRLLAFLNPFSFNITF